MKRKLIYLTSALCIGLASCQKDAELQYIADLQEIQETSVSTDTILLPDYNAAVEMQRGLRPLAPQNDQNTTDDENRGEKGRDRRDGNIGWYDNFDADAPLARLKFVSSDETAGTVTMKFVFGPYTKETIEYMFKWNAVEILFRNSSREQIYKVYTDEYHIGDTFTIPMSVCEKCYFIHIESRWFTHDASGDLYDGEQLYYTIYQ